MSPLGMVEATIGETISHMTIKDKYLENTIEPNFFKNQMQIPVHIANSRL
jgi:hypothetical protein